MSIFDLLQADNARILNILHKLQTSPAGRPDIRRRLLSEAGELIRRRARVTEELLEPILSRESETRDAVAVSRDARRSIEELLNELEETPTRDPHFRQGTESLYSRVERLVRREERDLLPTARRLLSEDQAVELGDRAFELEHESARTS